MSMNKKIVAIGNDHAATDMKKEIVSYLEAKGYEVINVGTDDNASVDYPIYAKKVCDLINDKKADCGILICGTGIGMSMAANKEKGIRAAVVSDETSTRLTRLHNDCNVLCFGARIIGLELAKNIVTTYLETDFSNEPKHKNRIEMYS